VGDWKDYVLTILATCIGLLVSLWVGVLSWLFKGQVARIDALEDAKANRVSTNKRFDDILSLMDRNLNRMERHMDEDSDRFRELTSSITSGTQRLEDKISGTNDALGSTNEKLGEVIGELKANRGG
jgi:methyl-accepting chemotaxis protein